MSEENKKGLNKKVVIPVTAAAIILAGAGIGGYKYVQLNLDDKTKQAIVDNNSNNNDNEANNDSVNANNDNNENADIDNTENEVEINYSDDGKITFNKKDTDNNSNQYSHLKDIVEQKAKDESVIIVLGDDKPKFEKDNEETDDNLLASIDKNPLPNLDTEDNNSSNNGAIPSEPSDPNVPVSPEKPTEPEKPVIPIEPIEPIEPVEPVEPEEPEKPTEPEKPEVNKSDLGNVIANASTYNSVRYTNSSWEKLSIAITEGYQLLDDKNAKQGQIDRATEKIKNALDGLVVKAPTLIVNGLEDLDNNVSTEEIININVSASDVDGNRVRTKVVLNNETISGSRGNYELKLQEGKNTLNIIVEDRFGGKTEETFEIIYEVEDLLEGTPIINISGLTTDNIKDGKLAFAVASTDFEGNEVKTEVLFNGGEITSNDSVNYEVELVEGKNTFEFKATDDNGAYTTKVVVIEYESEDKEAILNVTNVDENYINDGILVINAEALTKDNKKITPTVTNNGTTIEANGVQYAIKLDEGINNIVVEVVTESGITIKEYYTINYVVETPEVEEPEEDVEESEDTSDTEKETEDTEGNTENESEDNDTNTDNESEEGGLDQPETDEEVDDTENDKETEIEEEITEE